jgi:hypothetical protein
MNDFLTLKKGNNSPQVGDLRNKKVIPWLVLNFIDYRWQHCNCNVSSTNMTVALFVKDQIHSKICDPTPFCAFEESEKKGKVYMMYFVKIDRYDNYTPNML